MLLFYQFSLGFLLSLFVAVSAWFLQWLTISGVIAAIVSGTLIITFGPWYSIFLVGFFFASSGVIQMSKGLIYPHEENRVAKGSRRDLLQVWANILPSLIALLLFHFKHNEGFLLAFVVGIASCTADTWGSDLGVLSAQPPRHLFTGKRLAPGLSGGVSLLGTCASLVGSTAIVFLYASSTWLSGLPLYLNQLIQLIALGFLGSLIDSALGATIQVRYQCVVCGQLTEKNIHHDQPTRPVSGWPFVSNEAVNFLSNCLVVSIAILLYK